MRPSVYIIGTGPGDPDLITVRGLEYLRTADGVSKVVTANAVLTSLLMFGFIYFLLFLVWVYVMNDKIHHGPEPLPALPTGTTPQALLDAASLAQDEGRASLTDIHQDLGKEGT